jgi:quercetin dioxygenase-like cupin family protein
MTDFYVVDNKFAPGGTTGWHSHPGPSLIVVVSGTITNYDSGNANCAGADYSAGQSFVDSGDDVHMLRNNGSATAETIAVQFVPADINRRIDESAPVNCT